jgi:hypothetical protein
MRARESSAVRQGSPASRPDRNLGMLVRATDVTQLGTVTRARYHELRENRPEHCNHQICTAR